MQHFLMMSLYEAVFQVLTVTRKRDKGPAPEELMLGVHSNNKTRVVIPDFN